jgi:hypothetical protein
MEFLAAAILLRSAVSADFREVQRRDRGSAEGGDVRRHRHEFIGFLEGMTLTKKLPTLADVANTAVFLASDHAAAISGAVANLTCGMSVD